MTDPELRDRIHTLAYGTDLGPDRLLREVSIPQAVADTANAIRAIARYILEQENAK